MLLPLLFWARDAVPSVGLSLRHVVAMLRTHLVKTLGLQQLRVSVGLTAPRLHFGSGSGDPCFPSGRILPTEEGLRWRTARCFDLTLNSALRRLPSADRLPKRPMENNAMINACDRLIIDHPMVERSCSQNSCLKAKCLWCRRSQNQASANSHEHLTPRGH